MDFTQFLFDEQYLTAIGWTLAHSIWQIALISGLLWVIVKFMSKASPQLRYWAGMSALVLILVVSCWTFVDQLGQMRESQMGMAVASISSGQVSSEFFFHRKEDRTSQSSLQLSFIGLRKRKGFFLIW